MTNHVFISEEEIERALDYLRDHAADAAQARANRVYVEEYRKVVKAEIMKEHQLMPLGSQEREAYSDPRYIQHLEAIKQAVMEDERHRFLLDAAKAKIDAWRTMQATERAAKL